MITGATPLNIQEILLKTIADKIEKECEKNKSLKKNMSKSELQDAFSGRGGTELLTWLCLHGHIHNEIGEDAVALAEHNFVKRLFQAAGILVLPRLGQLTEEETNLIDKELDSD